MDSNLHKQCTLHYPLGFCSDIRTLTTIFFKKLETFIGAGHINVRFSVCVHDTLISMKICICSSRYFGAQ
jgi:hypothetical protein